jgi:NAD(P)-dependent dehydrogenase (short-subunit alcohol dehydrogenase family)
MMADMAVELRKHNIATVSLWPGLVSTEAISDMKDGKFGERASKVVCAVFQDF